MCGVVLALALVELGLAARLRQAWLVLTVEEAIARYGHETVRQALLPFVSEARQARIDEVLECRLQSLAVVLVDLHDPHNGAATVRSAEAFGLSEIHAVEAREPFQIARKITIGCEQWMDIHQYPDFERCAAELRRRGMALTATRPDGEMRIEDLDGSKPRALLFGNEHDGLSDEVVAQCTEVVRIPMFGFTQSFNLSVSVALMVQRAAELRRAALGRPGDLSDEKKQLLRAAWYSKGLRGAAGIIERYVAPQTH